MKLMVLRGLIAVPYFYLFIYQHLLFISESSILGERGGCGGKAYPSSGANLEREERPLCEIAQFLLPVDGMGGEAAPETQSLFQAAEVFLP